MVRGHCPNPKENQVFYQTSPLGCNTGYQIWKKCSGFKSPYGISRLWSIAYAKLESTLSFHKESSYSIIEVREKTYKMQSCKGLPRQWHVFATNMLSFKIWALYSTIWKSSFKTSYICCGIFSFLLSFTYHVGLEHKVTIRSIKFCALI